MQQTNDIFSPQVPPKHGIKTLISKISVKNRIIIPGNTPIIIWVIYKPFKPIESIIKEIIVFQINKYNDIKVEPEIKSNCFFFSE